MGLRDALRRLRGTEERAIDSVPWDVGGSLRPAAVSVDQALGLVPVFASVRLLASQVASLPLQTYRKSGDTRQKIPSFPLFTHPSVQGTLYDWLHRCMTSLALRGNAFGYITQRDRDQYPTMIEWLHPDDVRVDDRMPSGPGSYTNPVWYWQGRVIPAEDLLHIPWFTVPGRVLGLSPIGACAATISTGLSAMHYTSDWFDSGAVPPGEFKNTGKRVNQEEADIISARLNAAIKRRRPLVYGSDWEYKPIAVAAHEAKFIETMRMNATQIASIYGIPPEMIGGEAGGPLTYNTVESNAAGLEKFTLRPWLTLLEAAFFQLMPRPQYVKFNVDSLLRTDLQTRMASYQTGRQIGLYNIDEARAIEDLPPLPNGEGQDYTPLQILTGRAAQPATQTRYLPRHATDDYDYVDAEVIDVRHMPGLHDQKTHGRPGIKGALKKAAKEIAEAVTDGGDKPTPPARRPRKPRAAKALTGKAALRAAPAELGEGDFTRGGNSSLDAEPFIFYRDSGYEDINAYKRALGLGEDPDDVDPDGEFRAIADNMDAAFKQSRLTQPVVVYRGVAELDGMLGGIDTDRSLVGLEYVEDAYSSTTADRRVTEGFGATGVILTVTVPSGVGAIQLSKLHEGEFEGGRPSVNIGAQSIADIVHEPDFEAELLLEGGLRFRVTSDTVVDGRRELGVEVVP